MSCLGESASEPHLTGRLQTLRWCRWPVADDGVKSLQRWRVVGGETLGGLGRACTEQA